MDHLNSAHSYLRDHIDNLKVDNLDLNRRVVELNSQVNRLTRLLYNSDELNRTLRDEVRTLMKEKLVLVRDKASFGLEYVKAQKVCKNLRSQLHAQKNLVFNLEKDKKVLSRVNKTSFNRQVIPQQDANKTQK